MLMMGPMQNDQGSGSNSSAEQGREEEIFDAVVVLSADERSPYLDQACNGDVSLRRRLEVLLRSHAKAESFLEPAASGNPTIAISLGPTENPGDVIGHYKIREKLGEGGCGAVYVAEQTEPVRRRVALKVIKLGMDTRNVIA